MKLTVGLDKKPDCVSPPEVSEPAPPPYVSEQPPIYNVENPDVLANSTKSRTTYCSKVCCTCTLLVVGGILAGVLSWFFLTRLGCGVVDVCDRLSLVESYYGHAVINYGHGLSYIVPTQMSMARDTFEHKYYIQFAVKDNYTKECFYLNLESGFEEYKHLLVRLECVTEEPDNGTAVFMPERYQEDYYHDDRCLVDKMYPFCGRNTMFKLRALTGNFTFDGDAVNYIIKKKRGDSTSTSAP